MGFLFQLWLLIVGFIGLLTFPFRWANEQYRESPRARGFLFSVPALFIGMAGVALVTAGQIGRETDLIKRYDQLAISKQKVYVEELANFNIARRLVRASNQQLKNTPSETETSETNKSDGSNANADQNSGNNDAGDELSNEEKLIRDRIKGVRQDEQIFLEKLISLNPGDDSYRFRYAMAFEFDNEERQFQLMQKLAPDDSPGYSQAHFWMAYQLFAAPANSQADNRRNKLRALGHSDHCLILDKSRRDAKVIKGQALVALDRLPEAILVFKDLFDTDPEFFEAIVAINKLMQKDSDNLGVYELAAQRLEGRIRSSREVDANKWSVAVRQFMVCMYGKESFERAEETIKTEERLNEKDAVRLEFLKERHAENYSMWSQSLDRIQPKTDAIISEMLSKLEKSIGLRPRYEQALQQIARISVDHPLFSEQALKLYDPLKDKDAPSTVLQVLGNSEMLRRNYSRAVSLYEEARRKSPKDPHILNNLAYSYLMSNSGNADRSLFLVDEALAMLPRITESIATRSAFLHTRGSALLQLNRLEEAAGSFEMALQTRPDDVGILESLVKCYAARDPLQAAAYQKHLDVVREKANAAPSEPPVKPTTTEKNDSNNSSQQPTP